MYCFVQGNHSINWLALNLDITRSIHVKITCECLILSTEKCFCSTNSFVPGFKLKLVTFFMHVNPQLPLSKSLPKKSIRLSQLSPAVVFSLVHEFTNDIVQLIPCLKYCKLKAFYHFVLQNNCSYANKEQFMDRMQMEMLICFLSQ